MPDGSDILYFLFISPSQQLFTRRLKGNPLGFYILFRRFYFQQSLKQLLEHLFFIFLEIAYYGIN